MTVAEPVGLSKKDVRHFFFLETEPRFYLGSNVFRCASESGLVHAMPLPQPLLQIAVDTGLDN